MTTTTTSPSTPSGPTPPPPVPAWQRRALLALVLALVLALAAAATLVVLDQRGAAREDRDRAITVAAREAVAALINITPTDAQASFDRAIAGATGQWRQQLVQDGGALTGAITGAQLNVRSVITESGIVEADDDRATVLLAANMFVGSSDAQAAPRPFRARVVLERADGGWLVSGLEGLS